ncbi:MAG: hypothetical protein KDK51_10710, partial [Deltaproteobacteria bacterium]|nr:hypothetical protein [Deltaproteobacteria bacterium]
MKSLPQRIFQLIYLSTSLILLHNTAIAKSLPDPFFTFFEKSRYLRLNLSSLRKGDSQVKQLRNFIIQKQADPTYSNQDLFTVAYLFAIEENFQSAFHYAKQIEPGSTLSAMAHCFILYFWTQSDEPLHESQSAISAYKNVLLTQIYRLPSDMNQELVSTLDHLTLLELSKTEPADITPYFVMQAMETFHAAKVSTKAKGQLLLDLHTRLQNQPENVKRLFYHELQQNFSTIQEIKKIIPASMQTEKDPEMQVQQEEQAQAILEQAQVSLKNKDKQQALAHWQELFHYYPHTQSHKKALQNIRTFLRNEFANQTDVNPILESLKKLPPEILYSEGRYLWNAQKNETALALFEAFVQSYSYHTKAPNVHYIIASIYESWNQFDQALLYYKK